MKPKSVLELVCSFCNVVIFLHVKSRFDGMQLSSLGSLESHFSTLLAL